MTTEGKGESYARRQHNQLQADLADHTPDLAVRFWAASSSHSWLFGADDLCTRRYLVANKLIREELAPWVHTAAKIIAGLTDEDANILRLYAAQGFRDVWRAAEGEHYIGTIEEDIKALKMEDTETAEYQLAHRPPADFVARFSAIAAAAAVALPVGVYLFEGLGLLEPELNVKVGDEVTRWRPTSTSYSLQSAVDFAQSEQVLVIFVHRIVESKLAAVNMQALHMPSRVYISDEGDVMDSAWSEAEIMIPGPVRFRVVREDHVRLPMGFVGVADYRLLYTELTGSTTSEA